MSLNPEVYRSGFIAVISPRILGERNVPEKKLGQKYIKKERGGNIQSESGLSIIPSATVARG